MQVHVLAGQVSYEDLYQACRGQKYYAVHFATEIVPEKKDGIDWYNRILLSDDETIGLGRIATIVKECQAEVVFLNGCNSDMIAAHLAYQVGVRYVICTTVELRDDYAWDMPAVFYRYLAGGESVYQAFLNALIADYQSKYILLAPPPQDVPFTVLDEIRSTLIDIYQAIINTYRDEPEDDRRATILSIIILLFFSSAIILLAWVISRGI